MMKKTRFLLIADGVINVLLGLLLLLFPFGIATVLGVPASDTNFYPTLLGSVLVGIGIALLIEAWGEPRGLHGLGLMGAIVINCCGGGVLLLWLLLAPLQLPLRGTVILWTIAIVVLAVGIMELMARPWKQS